MTSELRKTGISIVGDVPWGAHFCSFYETKQDLLDILIPYFKTGLENNEFCLWVISNSELLTVEEATSALRNALPDLDRYVAERSLEIVGHDEWFLSGKTFDPHKVANRFKKKLSEALEKGYAGMRVNGSPAWLRDAGPKELRKFEAELDKLFPNERTIASCTYPLASIGGEEIFDVVRTHQFAIARRQGAWEAFETPALIQAKQEIEKLNEELEQRVIERTNELRVANEELKANSEQLRALSAGLESAREEEAKRIAREVHDELGSALSSLRWELEEFDEDISETTDLAQLPVLRQKIDGITRLTDSTISVVRRISSELRPIALDELGLIEAIEWHAQQFQARTGIICRSEYALEEVHFKQDQSTAIFRIFQEAMTNILRHAQSTRVDINIKEEAGEFVLTISDNGRGITENEIAGQSLGLLGLHERAHLMGGEISVVGGQGTTIKLRIPIRSK